MVKRLNLIRGALLLLGISLVGSGLLREENVMVLKKAVNICLECIGIG